MKLYKFRPLGDERDLERAKDILNTGKFWCSRFYELNDPMEGVFITKGFSGELFNQKNGRVICSFSAKRTFKNPAMWGYYANAFKGIAIEIEVENSEIINGQAGDCEIDDGKVYKIVYTSEIQSINGQSTDNKMMAILKSKFNQWKHEAEYRFIKKSVDSEHKVGEITAVYFGNPYNVINRSQICENSKTLQCYDRLKKQLMCYVENPSIKCFDIGINDNGKVIKGNQIKYDSLS